MLAFGPDFLGSSATENNTCCILVPVAKKVEEKTKIGLDELEHRGYPVRFLIGCSQIDLARSILASWAVREGFKQTMWIDSDVVFNPDNVDKLRKNRCPFIAGLYVKKDKSGFAARFKKHTDKIGFGAAGSVCHVEFVGMGFTLINTEVYRAVDRKEGGMPRCDIKGEEVLPYFLPMIVAREYLSEDYSFCLRAKRAHFPIQADTRIRLGHMKDGGEELTWDDLIGHKDVPGFILKL